MATLVGKAQSVSIFDMSSNVGGMNVATSPDALPTNECVDLTNFEFSIDGNKLMTRRGIKQTLATLGGKVTTLWYDNVMNELYIFVWNSSNNPASCDIYIYTGTGTPTKVGTCSGTDMRPSCVSFGGNVFIASGSYLQAMLNSPPSYLTNHANTLITLSGGALGNSNENVCTSPVCNIVTRDASNSGRIMVCHTGDDKMYYSAVGDTLSSTSYTNDASDESSSQWVRVGYKDNGEIVGAFPLATTVVVFKDNGNIYTIEGAFPDISISLVGTKSYCISKDAIVNIGNDIVYLSKYGLRTLSSSMTYGNFSQESVGEKCNPSIRADVSSPWISHLPNTDQLAISGKSDNIVWIYHTDLKAFTRWKAPDNNEITSIVDAGNVTYIATGNYVCTLDSSVFTDFDSVKVATQSIHQTYMSRRVENDELMISYRENIRVTPLLTTIIDTTNNYVGHGILKCYTGVILDDSSTPITINDWYYTATNPKTQFKTQIKDDRLQYSYETDYPIVLTHLSATLILKKYGMVAQTSGKADFDITTSEETSPYGYA